MTRLIDADSLYRKVKTECNKYGAPTIDFESGNKVLDMIEQEPTVEPKQGEFKCTECHRTFSKFSNVSFNYCPHCGREVERR